MPSCAPAPEAAERSPQAPKGFVVLAIGLPGSGKTTWFRRRGITPLSSDLLRNILFDDVEEQRYQGLVFSTLRSLLRARLIARMPLNYVDATNLSIHERRQWIKMAKSFGYEVQAVFFDVPLDVCLDRNRQRDRSVSEEDHAQDGRETQAARIRRRLRKDHRGEGEKRQLKDLLPHDHFPCSPTPSPGCAEPTPKFPPSAAPFSTPSISPSTTSQNGLKASPTPKSTPSPSACPR